MPVIVFVDADGIITVVRTGLLRLPEMEEALAQSMTSPSQEAAEED
jgi:hypothetical protein